jgi:thiol-disulfide isomerase/thioredoxin
MMNFMKKVLLTMALFTGLVSNAQIADGSVAPDFTATDINGNSYTLSTILAQGKTVILDISATWCGPCWSYHESHALKNLYNAYGPDASDEVMVFLVEGDGSTTLADLQGTGSNTTGDWVTGTPYPILDNAQIADDYQIAYFPTVYRICPDGFVYEMGQKSTAEIVTDINSACGTTLTGVTNHAEVAGSEIALCSTQGGADIEFHNYGSNAITAATFSLKENGTEVATTSFSGSVAQFASGTASFATMTINPTSTYTVTMNTVNGNAPYNADVTVDDMSVVSATSTGYDITINCMTDNYPGEISWNIRNSNGDIVVSGGPYQAGTDDQWGGGGADANTVKSSTFTLPSVTDCYSVEMLDSYGDGWSLGSTDHGIEIVNGTTTIFTALVDNFGDAITKEAAMKTDVNSASVSTIEANEFVVFPNPATEVVNVSFDAVNAEYSVALLDVAGRTVTTNVYTNLSGNQTVTLPVAGLEAGIYMIAVTTEGVTSTQQVVIK